LKILSHIGPTDLIEKGVFLRKYMACDQS